MTDGEFAEHQNTAAWLLESREFESFTSYLESAPPDIPIRVLATAYNDSLKEAAE